MKLGTRSTGLGDAQDTVYGNPDWTASLDNIAPGYTSMINTQSQPGESWIDTAQRLMTAVIMTNQQRQLMEIQLERARNNLPPLTVDQYGMGVNVGVNDSTQKMILWAVGGIAVSLLVGQMLRR